MTKHHAYPTLGAASNDEACSQYPEAHSRISGCWRWSTEAVEPGGRAPRRNAWLDRYSVALDHLPPFVSPQLADTILRAGGGSDVISCKMHEELTVRLHQLMVVYENSGQHEELCV